MQENTTGLKFEESGLSPERPVKYFVRRFESDRLIRLHYHNSLEINVCMGVRGVIRLESGEYDLSEDCLIFIPPGVPHSYHILKSGGTIDVHHFLIKEMPGVEAALSDSLRFAFLPVLKCLSVLKILDLLHSGREGVLSCSGYLLIIADEINCAGSLPQRQYLPDRFLRKVVDYTERNYMQRLSLGEISEYAGVSKYHFCRLFKKMTGESWSSYLKAVRLNRSLEMLAGGIQVGEAAAACGFESDSYFIKCFRDEYSLTPLQWRNARDIRPRP